MSLRPNRVPREIAVIALVAVIAACQGSATSGSDDSTAALSSSSSAFQFHGRPINPLWLREFLGWASDRPPSVVNAIDMDSCESSNRYDSKVEKMNDDTYVARYDDGWINYKYLGRTYSNTAVLLVRSGGQGTYSPTSVWLLRFEDKTLSLYDDGRKPKVSLHSTLRFAGEVVLGDRYDGTARLQGSRLMVGPSKYNAEQRVYDLP